VSSENIKAKENVKENNHVLMIPINWLGIAIMQKIHIALQKCFKHKE